MCTWEEKLLITQHTKTNKQKHHWSISKTLNTNPMASHIWQCTQGNGGPRDPWFHHSLVDYETALGQRCLQSRKNEIKNGWSKRNKVSFCTVLWALSLLHFLECSNPFLLWTVRLSFNGLMFQHWTSVLYPQDL